MHKIQNVSLVMNEVSFVQFLSRSMSKLNKRMQLDKIAALRLQIFRPCEALCGNRKNGQVQNCFFYIRLTLAAIQLKLHLP